MAGSGGDESAQLDADRKYWEVAPAKKPHLRAIVFIVDGTVERIRAVDPAGAWIPDPHRPRFWDIPLTEGLSLEQVAEQLPTLDLRLGDAVPHQRGKLREHRAL